MNLQPTMTTTEHPLLFSFHNFVDLFVWRHQSYILSQSQFTHSLNLPSSFSLSPSPYLHPALVLHSEMIFGCNSSQQPIFVMTVCCCCCCDFIIRIVQYAPVDFLCILPRIAMYCVVCVCVRNRVPNDCVVKHTILYKNNNHDVVPRILVCSKANARLELTTREAQFGFHYPNAISNLLNTHSIQRSSFRREYDIVATILCQIYVIYNICTACEPYNTFATKIHSYVAGGTKEIVIGHLGIDQFSHASLSSKRIRAHTHTRAHA